MQRGYIRLLLEILHSATSPHSCTLWPIRPPAAHNFGSCSIPGCTRSASRLGAIQVVNNFLSCQLGGSSAGALYTFCEVHFSRFGGRGLGREVSLGASFRARGTSLRGNNNVRGRFSCQGGGPEGARGGAEGWGGRAHSKLTGGEGWNI